MVSFLAGHGNLLSTSLKHVESPPHRSSWYICPSQDNTVLRQTHRHFPITLIPSRSFSESVPRAKLHPLHILSRYTSLSLFYLKHSPTAIGRFLAYCLSPRLATQALDTYINLDPFVLGLLIPDDGVSTHLWNVGRQSFYMAVYPTRQLWTSSVIATDVFHLSSLSSKHCFDTTSCYIQDIRVWGVFNSSVAWHLVEIHGSCLSHALTQLFTIVLCFCDVMFSIWRRPLTWPWLTCNLSSFNCLLKSMGML
jgi:hypothetical protein